MAGETYLSGSLEHRAPLVDERALFLALLWTDWLPTLGLFQAGGLPFCHEELILFCCPMSLDTLGAHSNAKGLGSSACNSCQLSSPMLGPAE